ncbi:MAG: LLM class flavin-dependent oxidoreductase [Actinobacteria bacterium]|nr:LLM class flavin-dependent oxidoreductase [Actinomycetota bacterium]
MRVDILHALRTIRASTSWSELLDETREVAVLADELGFDGFWLGEHHFDSYGTDQCPNPVMLAADLAARTERLRLGMAAVTLPLWHPVRLAEDLAMLDQFSAGRLDVAFSRGILQPEIVNFNAEADRRNDEASRAIFAENLNVLKRAWTEDPFSWKGERHEFPHPTTKWPKGSADRYRDEEGNALGLPIIPGTVQKPTPPLFTVTESREGFISGAQEGIGVITWYPTGGVLRGLIDAYVEEAERAGTAVPGEPPRVALLRGCCVAPTDEEARRMIEPIVDEQVRFITSVRGLKVWLDEGEDPEDPELTSMPPFDLLLERDHLLVGSPESVAERMIRMMGTFGVDHWLLSFYSGKGDEQAERTMQLLAAEVLPEVRRAAERLTTGQGTR